MGLNWTFKGLIMYIQGDRKVSLHLTIVL